MSDLETDTGCILFCFCLNEVMTYKGNILSSTASAELPISLTVSSDACFFIISMIQCQGVVTGCDV